MTTFAGVGEYAAVFRRYVGRRLYMVFALTALAGLAEGLGIAMLLPLLAALDMGGDAQGAAPRALVGAVEWVGLGGSLIGILVLIGALFLAKGVIQFAAAGYTGYLQAQLLRELKGRLFDAYGRMDYLYYVRGDTGHFVNVINSQVSAFYSAFSAFMGFVTRVIMATAYLGIAMLLAWRFGIMAIGVGLILLLLFRRMNVWVRDLSRLTSQETSHLNKLLVQTLQAFKYLSSTAQVKDVRQGVMDSIGRMTGYRVRQQVALAFTGAINEPLSVSFIILIIMVQVAVLDQPLAPILVAILLFHRGMHSVFGIQNGWQGMLNNIGSVEMVRDELDALDVHRERGGSRTVPVLASAVELRNVHFAYDTTHGAVLRDVSIEIPARTTVALVGESGAGKSTLVDLITLLLKPTRGQVLIDGVPGREVHFPSWRAQIGYVSQETVVFDDTIAANIALGVMASADPEIAARIRAAARSAHIAHFVEELPRGYDTVVGERGIRLSGGQRQRLFIARELFRRPNLLILDEATSALDTESERMIQASIDALRGEMTVILIAHRLSTIRNVDRVYVLQRGRVIEEGAYEELRERADSRFRSMVELQTL